MRALPSAPICRTLGLVDYLDAARRMRAFNDERAAAVDRGSWRDELWVLQHPAVYTLGRRANPDDVFDRRDIPAVRCDRGGQVTYHGPGQLVVYLMLDAQRGRLGPRRLVALIERAIVDCLAIEGVSATVRGGAPGVYVEGRKIASLGLRISRGLVSHGLALNVSMDLAPFERIVPCGQPGLQVTSLARELAPRLPQIDAVDKALTSLLCAALAAEAGRDDH